MKHINDTKSLAWVCEHHASRVRALFEALNLDAPALAKTKAAAERSDWPAACAALLDYYRECDSGRWLRHDPVAPSNRVDPTIDKFADALFPVPGHDVRIPRLPNGSFDWGHIPPLPGGGEWVYGINRHDYMTEVLHAFFATGNRRYVRALDEQLGDWLATIPRPAADDPRHSCPWGSILEVGHRCKAWPGVFYGLQCEADLSPATRILLLCRSLEHALFLRKLHTSGSNWVITELTGLLSIAAAFPEFRDASEWRERALSVVHRELMSQVYPDGTQHELSSNYQVAVLLHIEHFMSTVRGAGLRVEPEFVALLEDMWNYVAYSLGPNGFAPHNGDSDRCVDTNSTVIRPQIATGPLLHEAEINRRPDWTYIVTNGVRGEKSAGLPSVFFPWAGQLIMRNGFDPDAHWGYFDIGPWGKLHQHNDSLHLSITAFGRDLLVDAGRYTYENYWGGNNTWRGYFAGAASHNVILVDGLGQQESPRVATKPIDDVMITPEFDYAQGTFAGGFSDADTVAARLKAVVYGRTDLPQGITGAEHGVTHTRGVLYLRGIGWIVVDRVEVDRPHKITPIWHFHPECKVERDGQSVVTTDKGVGNLRITPIGGIMWDIELVRGREGPDFQGWYSPEMDVRLPNTCACYSTRIEKNTTTAWLLLPANGDVPRAKITRHESPEGTFRATLDGVGTKLIDVTIQLDTKKAEVRFG